MANAVINIKTCVEFGFTALPARHETDNINYPNYTVLTNRGISMTNYECPRIQREYTLITCSPIWAPRALELDDSPRSQRTLRFTSPQPVTGPNSRLTHCLFKTPFFIFPRPIPVQCQVLPTLLSLLSEMSVTPCSGT